MGEVYRAFDVTLERRVALKVLPPDVLDDVERVRRFVQEARAASALNHPNIVTVYEIGQSDVITISGEGRAHFIAMELIDGATLRAHMQSDPLPRVLEMLAQAAEGLAKAHGSGIVHRDLKPDNIMVTSDGYAKVVDFGLAKLIERTEDVRLTQEGMMVGTIGYMSPEQVQGLDLDWRSDVFAFGCIVYEACAGRRPFEGGMAVDTMHRIVFAEPDPLESAAPGTPPEVCSLVAEALRKNRDARTLSMRDFATRLRLAADALQRSSHGGGRTADRVTVAPVPLVPVNAHSSGPAIPAPVRPDAKTRAFPLGAWVARAAVLAVALFVVWTWVTIPDIEILRSTNPEVAGQWVELDDVSDEMRDATVNRIDENFYERLPRNSDNAKKIVMASWEQRSLPRIVSPITVATAREIYAEGSSNPLFVARSWVHGFVMERSLSRDRILELYLNTTQFREVQGIGDATHQIFDVRTSRLDERQAAYLLGLTDDKPERRAAAPKRTGSKPKSPPKSDPVEPVVVDPQPASGTPPSVDAPAPDATPAASEG